jgi:hypothetical protein
MSALLDKQMQFVSMLGKLICHAQTMGYQLTFPDPRLPHMKNSLHYIGLAQDLNLFINGKFMASTEAHQPLGEFWESIGGSWGGRFKPKTDGNHYSLEYQGRK